MSDKFEPELASKIAYIDNLRLGSKEEVEAICDILESLSLDIKIPMRFAPDRNYVLGTSGEKMFRIELGGGILVQPLSPDPEVTEEGYIYQHPEIGIAWLLCKLGFGGNSTNFETDVVTYKGIQESAEVRIAFEEKLTEEQKMFYKSMDTIGFSLSDNSDARPFGSVQVKNLRVAN